MASSQRKSGSSAGRGKPLEKKQITNSKGRSCSRKPAAPGKKPIRREVGAVVCLLLALFGGIGYFKTDEGAFIALFCNLLKGLWGYGFYITPPILLLAAWILAFHGGRPVRLRVGGAFVLPMLVGTILHLLLFREEYQGGAAMFSQLWQGGLALSSGGVISGLLAGGLQAAFSLVGAMAVLLLAGIAALLCAFRITPADILGFVRERREKRVEYDLEEYEQPVKRSRQREADGEKPAVKSRKPDIDIPVDDGPPPQKHPDKPIVRSGKKRLFDQVARVVSPDKVLTGRRAYDVENEEMPPAAQSDLEWESERAPLSQADQPISPPVIREPAVTQEEVRQAQEEIAREIEVGTDQNTAYRYPPISLLNQGGSGGNSADGELQANQQRLQEALRSFGVDAHIVNVTRGPSVTRYELELEQGVKLNKLTNLSDDIALALGAAAVRVAPIPDRISTVGIEVPNRQVSPVVIRELIGSRTFINSQSKVSFAVGKDIAGNCIVGDIAKLPHMLIAGTTGSGKSVCTNGLIVSLLYKATPEEVRLIMVDPKMVELGVYNGIPHLLIPVVTDPKKAAGALQWAGKEMMKRYRMFSEVGAKDLVSYNNHARKEGRDTMPQIVVVIDELADLMLVAAKEVEESICRVAQMGRASGMHLIIATQRPSSDVITGLMKANIPSRIAFAVDSAINSRIILDTSGAEKLVGKGDMLYAPLGKGKLRVQGCFISEEEVANVVEFIKESTTAQYDETVMHEIEKNAEEKEKGGHSVGAGDCAGGEDYDQLLPAAIDVVLEMGQASVSMLQRRLKLGYGRAARLVDQMEERGVVGPFEGSKPRQLLITKEQWQEMQYKRDMVAVVPEEPPFEEDAASQSDDS